MRRAGGQATLELSLGLLVLVPTFFLGWAFFESGMVSMKVTEAADSALWDSTADRRDGFGEAYASAAAGRYSDFDGRSSANGGGRIRGVASTSERLEVRCAAAVLPITQPLSLEPVMPPSRGRSCTATAQSRLWGDFTRAHCSQGRPDGIGGPCRGAQGLALDDGALLDARDCPVSTDGSGCQNTEYFGKVGALVGIVGAPSGASLTLVQSTLLAMPPHASTALDTYLSFQGEDAPSRFEQTVPYPGDGEFPRWQTTPFDYHATYRGSYVRRSSCHLGLACNGGAIDDP